MKKEEKTELTKKKILQAAMQEFGSKGYQGASLNAIVLESGLPKGLLYHNFKNKDALYLACVERCFQALTECLRKADIGDDLERYMQVRLHFFKEHTEEAGIFFDVVLQPPEGLLEELRAAKKEFDEINFELYRCILDSIQLREGVTYEEAMSYFTLLQEMFNSSFSRRSSPNISLTDKIELHERDLPKLMDFILYGIARRNKEC